ncbi:MAG TPA: ferritin-like domain-containing protein [Pyrinomonadaceae bacterium]|nr:ferritin-like domain-containing protein [Pyrinomonadaceae bacterium]
MIAVERYGQRSDAFDDLISGCHDHFWDPLDSRYIDYSEPFDLQTELVLPYEMFPEFGTAVVDKLGERERVHLANENSRWLISGLLHGEQAAHSLCANLCNILADAGAQEYASNQVREEARHVNGFARYIQARWGSPYPVGESLGGLLTELVQSPEVYKKLVGMQILVEGLAMSVFGAIHVMTNDPVLKRLTQLVMTDEAFHHKFGKAWADRTIPEMKAEERISVEDWAAHCFEKLLLNLVNVREKRVIYEQFGLDWEEVRTACEYRYGEKSRREQLGRQSNIFRFLAKTLFKSGIVTERTRPIYARWLDVDQLGEEVDGLDVLSDVVSQQGIEYLQEINRKRRSKIKLRPQ